MPTSLPPSRVSVCLVAVPGVSAAVVYGVHETFSAVGTAWQALTGGASGVRRMEPRIVAGRSVRNSVYRPPAPFHFDRSQPGVGEKRSSTMMANWVIAVSHRLEVLSRAPEAASDRVEHWFRVPVSP
jgi:hypothetical protein